MSPSIDSAKIRDSVFALLKWKKLQKQEDSDDFIYLILTLKTVVAKPLQSVPHRVPLPHPLHPLPNICLIIPDKPPLDSLHHKIQSQNIPISTLLKLAKVRSLCKTPDSRHKFFDSYDVFLADQRIFRLLLGVLGKGFCKKKLPVPVGLKGRILKEEVEEACSCQVLRFGSGSCHSVRVGEAGMGGGEIVENVREAINGAVEFVPKKWKGVAAIHLKFSESLAMPIYRKEEKGVSNEMVGK